MKSALLLTGFQLFASSTLVAAVSINDYPPCALTCLANNLAATGCGLLDFACSCSKPDFLFKSSVCIAETCSLPDILKAGEVSVGKFTILQISSSQIRFGSVLSIVK